MQCMCVRVCCVLCRLVVWCPLTTWRHWSHRLRRYSATHTHTCIHTHTHTSILRGARGDTACDSVLCCLILREYREKQDHQHTVCDLVRVCNGVFCYLARAEPSRGAAGRRCSAVHSCQGTPWHSGQRIVCPHRCIPGKRHTHTHTYGLERACIHAHTHTDTRAPRLSSCRALQTGLLRPCCVLRCMLWYALYIVPHVHAGR